MKLIIKEIERSTNKITGKWTWKNIPLYECLARIRELDGKYPKHYFKFEYIIREK